MSHGKGKDVDDIDIDYLLETLSPEELEKLGEELIDPDVSSVRFLCERRVLADQTESVHAVGRVWCQKETHGKSTGLALLTNTAQNKYSSMENEPNFM